MISGIYLVLEPKGKEAKAMRAILDGFLEEHEGIRDIDETTRRELKTIDFLRTKFLQMETQMSPVNEHATGEQQAQLLLDLHQGSVSSSPQRPFPSLLNIGPSGEGSSSGHSLPPVNTTPMVHSPTFQRLQANNPSSPTGSGSPGAEDESTAQSLLDHWCNTISNAPIDANANGMIWGGPGGADLTGWVGVGQPMVAPDPRLLSNIEGGDWNYWEALITQIQRGP